MRVDVEAFAFTTAADGATLADVNLQDADSFAVLVNITAHAGAATTTDVELVPRIGAAVFPATGSAIGDVIGIPRLTNETIGTAMTRIGVTGAAKTALIPDGFWIRNVLKEARVRAELTGAAHTITGVVYVLRKFL